MPTTPAPMSEAVFIRRVLIVVGILAFVAALYLLSDILLLIFGAVLVAVVLRAIAVPINRGTTLGQRFSLLAAGFGVLGLLAAIGYMFGAQISDQLVALVDNLPAAADSRHQIGAVPLGAGLRAASKAPRSATCWPAPSAGGRPFSARWRHSSSSSSPASTSP